MKHSFLSAEWLEQAKAIRDEYPHSHAIEDGNEIRANLVFTGAPGNETINAHLSASGLGSNIDLGHLDDPDAIVTTRYDIAKAIFCDGDFAASMKAFMAGEIFVTGDISKLLDLMTQVSDDSDPVNVEINRRVREMTLDDQDAAS